MIGTAQASLLPDGVRLHLHHGPIDLILSVDAEHREACFADAMTCFDTLLARLTRELPQLRCPVDPQTSFAGPVARRMLRAVRPHSGFVTPMAAVAGAVADEVLCAMLRNRDVQKAVVNNGGDIAFHLSGEAVLRVAGPAGPITLSANDPVRGVATSGWAGRSQSLGIADAVTVLASNAAAADVAATLIANAVDLPGHPAITRIAAQEIAPDSDLGDRPVTQGVGVLIPAEIDTALAAGLKRAMRMRSEGLIEDAILLLQGRSVSTVKEGSLAHA